MASLEGFSSNTVGGVSLFFSATGAAASFDFSAFLSFFELLLSFDLSAVATVSAAVGGTEGASLAVAVSLDTLATDDEDVANKDTGNTVAETGIAV